MSIFIKVSILIMLTYFWARGLTVKYEEQISLLEAELEKQKVSHEEEKLELELMIKLIEAKQ